MGRSRAFILFSTALFACSSFAASIESTSQIREFVRPFKTYTHQSLPGLLLRYGLSISRIETTPIESMIKEVRRVGDHDGDVVATLYVDGDPKPMPCGLHKWLTQGYDLHHAEDLSEIIVRRGKFVTDQPDLNPLLYWAATGKCSKSYGLPL